MGENRLRPGLDTLTVSNFARQRAAGMSYVTNVVGLDGGGIAMMHTMLGRWLQARAVSLRARLMSGV